MHVLQCNSIKKCCVCYWQRLSYQFTPFISLWKGLRQILQYDRGLSLWENQEYRKRCCYVKICSHFSPIYQLFYHRAHYLCSQEYISWQKRYLDEPHVTVWLKICLGFFSKFWSNKVKDQCFLSESFTRNVSHINTRYI